MNKTSPKTARGHGRIVVSALARLIMPTTSGFLFQNPGSPRIKTVYHGNLPAGEWQTANPPT